LTLEQFRRLPRSAGYRYAYHDGVAWLNPRPRYYHVLLDLATAPLQQPASLPIRFVGPEDWEAMAPVFAAAFAQHQPFAGLDDDTRLTAVRKSLRHTRNGGDGPWVELASFVAVNDSGDRIIGAALVTLLPQRDPSDWDSYHWTEEPPPDCIARRMGRPHLTWIFVNPEHSGHGVGTTLLAAVAGALRSLGYQELASTFLLGNESSMLWHWRSGFRLLSYPSSRRRTS
jgi:GNAT superfamily N-acetyltransferase